MKWHFNLKTITVTKGYDNKYFRYSIFAVCTKDSWLIGNGFCNDPTNIEVCGWDGGECCGDTTNKWMCTACECNEGT